MFFFKFAYLILITLLAFNCKSGAWRLHNPNPTTEGEKQTVVGFGHYRFGSVTKYLLGNAPEVDSTFTLVEVVSVDDKNKRIVIGKPFEIQEFVKGNKEGELEVFWGNAINNVTSIDDCISAKKRGENVCNLTKSIIVSHFDSFLFLDPKKQYAISRVHWIESCGGKGCRRTISWPINIYESFKVLPIRGKAGTVNFQGIYKFELKQISAENKSECFEEFQNKVVDYCDSENRKLVIAKVDSLPNEGYEYIKEAYYEDGKVSSKNSEIKYLKNLIQIQNNGYWKEKAEERLTAIGK